MKKIIVSAGIIVAIGIISCDNPRSNTVDPAHDSLHTAKPSAPTAIAVPDNNVDNPRASTSGTAYDQGAVLVANNNCKTCHAIDIKMTGPSYNQIANKYENTEGMRDELAYKIMKGGSGRWGNVVMPAHPSVSIEDGNEMAGYILSLRTKKL